MTLSNGRGVSVSSIATRLCRTAATIIVIAVASVAGGQAPPPSLVTHLSGFGQPLDALLQPQNASDLQLFGAGQLQFVEVETIPRIGPIFNSRSCAACHFQPALGGSGAFINEVRVRNNTAGGPLHIFATDNLLRAGPQTQGPSTVFSNGLESTPLGCQITSPKCSKSPCQREEASRTTFKTSLKLCDPTSAAFAKGTNCAAERQATPLFGLGFVEAVADSTFHAIAAGQPHRIHGTVKTVSELGATRVGRFGWKDDHATLRAFAGDAYLNEMGITSADFPQERSTCALNKVMFGVTLDEDDEPEDETEDDGRADIDRFADFMRALAPPPPLAPSSDAQAGHVLFINIGCRGCHVETITTAANPASFIPPTTGGVAISATMNALLANQTFHPFSDFLLHDMGSLGDGITSDAAGPTMMRTAPLWGIRARSRFLHDGRAETIADAIALHDGQGADAAQAFQQLSATQQQQILDFLNTI
ncbi:MAG TPA: di-heme oxidoredictase family protein [Candidatus Margulisiibacteriota bacterium]|nr:di-heme oxidoredictase family protein [Candidatus Margulisiibacteriota bacterium]